LAHRIVQTLLWDGAKVNSDRGSLLSMQLYNY
jgi:hypothetical protein